MTTTISSPAELRKARVGLRVLAVLAFAIVGTTNVAAQNVSPRPVARLIGSNFGTGRISGTETVIKVSSTVTAWPSLDEATEAEKHAFEATNEVRKKNGLLPLNWDPQLCLFARAYSRTMSELNFFSHKTPDGLRLRDRARLSGIRYRVIGENLAYNQGFEDPGAFAVERWTISPGHRANLLSAEFQGSAVGSFVAADGTVFLTQLFILR